MLLAALDSTAVIASGITGLTAVASGFIGYLASRLSSGVAKLQVEAETERFNAQHREEHLRHRQGVYHDLLNADRRVMRVLIDPALDRETAHDLSQQLYAHLNGAIVIGTENVARRAVEFAQVLGVVIPLGLKGAERSEIETHMGSWIQARRNLIDAMRQDVAPDAAPIADWESSAEETVAKS